MNVWMLMLDLDPIKEFVRDAIVDVNDANRCERLHITPSTGTLHRRLHRSIGIFNALIDEVERLRMSKEEQ